VFSTIVGETLRSLNVLPDNNVKQMALEEKSVPEIQTANAQAQRVALKR